LKDSARNMSLRLPEPEVIVLIFVLSTILAILAVAITKLETQLHLTETNELTLMRAIRLRL